MSSYNCLLIAPRFFGYAQAIQRALAGFGLSALLHDDRPSEDTLTKSLIRISPRLVAARSNAYFHSITREAQAHQIEEVLVVKGQALSAGAIRQMRSSFPNARFTLYFWDSYRNMSRDTPEKVGLFDRALTFDLCDARADRRLQYRPLFYLNDYAATPQQTKDIDLLFVGTMHTDRYRVIGRVQKAMPAEKVFWKHLYFVSPVVYQVNRLLNPAYWNSTSSDFRFTSLPHPDMRLLLARSRAVLDIERPIQSGLTMRTLEALAAGTKLITTNRYAIESDLYQSGNILVIERNDVVIASEFLSTRFRPLTPPLMERYSLDGWIAEVLPGRRPSVIAKQ